MNWAQKYRSLKDKDNKEKRKKDLPSEVLFVKYQEKLNDLYSQFNSMIAETMVQTKYHKIMISKQPRDSILAEKEKVDTLILSDNDNELKLIPEGIHFVGVLGRVAIRAYRKVYTFNSIIERRIKTIKEPYFVLIHDQDDENTLIWGYIKEEENAFFGHEVISLTESVIEKLLDEFFLSD